MLRQGKGYSDQVRARNEDRIHRALHQGELTVRAEPVTFEDWLGQGQEKPVVKRCVRVRHDRLRRNEPELQRHGHQH